MAQEKVDLSPEMREAKRRFPHKLDRTEAAEYLGAVHGLKWSPQYLAILASGKRYKDLKGPPFRKIGRTVIYDTADLDAWAIKALGKPAPTAIDHLRQREAV